MPDFDSNTAYGGAYIDPDIVDPPLLDDPRLDEAADYADW